jgi:hypothetical protein
MRSLRKGFATVVAAATAAALASACGSQRTVRQDGAATPAASPPVSSPASPTVAEDGPQPVYDRTKFSDPTNIDHRWLPLKPGTQLVYEGYTEEDDERVPHRLVVTVTDLTKVIDGVRNVVLWDRDYSAGELVEAELAFFAQADDGDIWHFGEYPEEYEDGEFVDAPTWIHGLEGAQAGITIRAEPKLGDPSHAQGWGPEVDWSDRARVHQVGQRTCVPAGCYDNVLVVDEGSKDEPDAHQYKYYAPGVGNVRVGYGGADPTRETLQLTKVVKLSPQGLAEVRAEALKLEKHAYEVSKDVYGRTAPAHSPLT